MLFLPASNEANYDPQTEVQAVCSATASRLPVTACRLARGQRSPRASEKEKRKIPQATSSSGMSESLVFCLFFWSRSRCLRLAPSRSQRSPCLEQRRDAKRKTGLRSTSRHFKKKKKTLTAFLLAAVLSIWDVTWSDCVFFLSLIIFRQPWVHTLPTFLH